MLRKTEHPHFEDMVGKLIAGSDLHTALAIVRSCLRLPDTSLVERLLARIRDREVPSGAPLDRVASPDRSADGPPCRGSRSRAPLPARGAVECAATYDALALVAGHSPGQDPGRQVAAWLRELSNTTIKLQVGNTPFEPNILGLPAFGPGCEEGLRVC